MRTGVTAIIPRGHDSFNDPVYAGVFSLNGNGEMTGTAWVEESGFLEGPVVITNTHSVGVARDAVIAWRVTKGAADKTGYWWSLPVVAETWDGYLNDINGFHVKPEHVIHALETAQGGPVAEGSVGGGTGMICYEFKGGTGTASRRSHEDGKDARRARYTIGAFVQANCGRRAATHDRRRSGRQGNSRTPFTAKRAGSIIIVVATDAPLLPHQLKRLARRASLRPGPHRQRFGKRLRRFVHRFLDRQSRRGRSRQSRRIRSRPSQTIGSIRFSRPPCKRSRKRS